MTVSMPASMRGDDLQLWWLMERVGSRWGLYLCLKVLEPEISLLLGTVAGSIVEGVEGSNGLLERVCCNGGHGCDRGCCSGVCVLVLVARREESAARIKHKGSRQER